MKKTNNTAFTLIEILVVTVILSVVSLAIFSTFSNGIKIWNRINKQTTGEDLVIFCDRLGLDLRNSLGFSGISFIGEQDRLEFATLLNSPRLRVRTVGRVSYVFSPDAKTLDRRQVDYSGVFNVEEPRITHEFGNVKSAKFYYYFYDKKNKEYVWLERWAEKGQPLAVRLEMEFKGEDEKGRFIRTFNIPAASQPEDE